MLTGWSAGWVNWWRIRTFLPVLAAAVNTVWRNSSLVMTCEQEKVKMIPPGLTTSMPFRFSFLYPWMALLSTFWCFANAGGSRMIKSYLLWDCSRNLKASSANASSRLSPGKLSATFCLANSIAPVRHRRNVLIGHLPAWHKKRNLRCNKTCLRPVYYRHIFRADVGFPVGR